MKSVWHGYHLDGTTPLRQPVEIRAGSQGLELVWETGKTAAWHYDEIRQTQGFYSDEPVRLERGSENPETLIVMDPDFLTDLRRLVPKSRKRLYHPTTRRSRVQLTIIAGFLTIAILANLFLWGIPALAEWVSPHIPPQWEEYVGQGVLQHLAPPELQCTDPVRTEKILRIVNRLTSPLQENPYEFRIMVVNRPQVNAFAVPGGTIVIHLGLLKQTQSAEELAGVLAHEIQHLRQRHITKALLHDASVKMIIAAISGDMGNALSFGLQSAQKFGELRYSRQSEREADRGGLDLLIEAGIDPSGLIRFFQSLQQQAPMEPELLKYTSTHPSTHERIEQFRAIADQSAASPSRLLAQYEWRDIDKICRSNRESANGLG